MPEVQDYVSGKILADIEKAFRAFQVLKIPLYGSKMKGRLRKELKKCEPRKIDIEEACRLIQKSNKCAVGERVCNDLHQNAEFAESVFLDELANGMVDVGKAIHVTENEAIDAIKRNRKYPIMITKVSGKYMEICRSLPKKCVYWNSEKHGLKCIKR